MSTHLLTQVVTSLFSHGEGIVCFFRDGFFVWDVIVQNEVFESTKDMYFGWGRIFVWHGEIDTVLRQRCIRVLGARRNEL